MPVIPRDTTPPLPQAVMNSDCVSLPSLSESADAKLGTEVLACVSVRLPALLESKLDQSEVHSAWLILVEPDGLVWAKAVPARATAAAKLRVESSFMLYSCVEVQREPT